MSVCVAGVDCSTQSTTVLVLDASSGAVLARGCVPHDVRGVGGARESDPREWERALAAALAQTGRAREIAAIAVAGQQHGLVVLDDAGAPLRPAQLWNDTTSAQDVTALLAAFGEPAEPGQAAADGSGAPAGEVDAGAGASAVGGAERWARLTGSVPTTSFTVAKWARLRRVEPQLAARAAAVRLPHDFLTERLCGAAVTDRGDASSTAWFSAASNAYVDEVLALPGVALDPALLPAVRRGHEVAGTVTSAAAEAFGLRLGAVVAVGTGDNPAAAVGLGLGPGVPVVSLGTSATAYALSARPTADASGALAGFADAGDRFLPLACTLNATLAVDRVARWLQRDREQVAPAGEVVMLPYLDGERTPAYPLAAGSVVGLRHATDPGQILQAAYDGVVDALVDALDLLNEQVDGGLDPEAPLILIGGGANGAAWRETVARLSGRALRIPDDADLVAVGAAALAAASLDGSDPYEVARRWGRDRAVTTRPAQPVDAARRERMRVVRERLDGLNRLGG
jgi:xylulokinase